MNKEDANAQCINNLVTLHMKRLNLKSQSKGTSMLKMLDHLQQKWNITNNRTSSGSHSQGKNFFINKRRMKSAERPIRFFRKPKKIKDYCKIEVKNDRKGRWCKKIERNCLERLDEIENINSLVQKTITYYILAF